MADTPSDRRANPSRSVVDALAHQRALTERLLLAALREHDASRHAIEASRRATFLASASQDLALSLDDERTRDAVRRRTLQREGSWCIVDLVDQNGVVTRLAVTHPDAAKQAAAQMLADRWFPVPPLGAVTPPEAIPAAVSEEVPVELLHELGFGGLLVVPLAVRGTVLGAMTFFTGDGDPSFSPDEARLASGIADLCALALDNARLFREANESTEVANAANRAKSNFLGNMSHELMTPLNAIGGYASLLEMGLRGPVTAEQHADLARIRHNARHLLTLISEILTAAHSDRRGLEYRFTDVAVNAAMFEVSDMLQGVAVERGVSLTYFPADPEATVWADANRVRQILLNLVMNAVKYAGAGGRITLSGVVTPDRAAISVADTGPGVPAAQLEAIFEPFVQLNSGLTDRRGGVGLGLAISRDLARAMHGDLTVHSTIGVGSRFTLDLPRAPQ